MESQPILTSKSTSVLPSYLELQTVRCQLLLGVELIAKLGEATPTVYFEQYTQLEEAAE